MSGSEELSTFLVFAKVLTASDPFDTQAAFQLLRTIDEAIGLPTENHMEAAIEASLSAFHAKDSHRTAVARYALTRVAIEIESRLRQIAS